MRQACRGTLGCDYVLDICISAADEWLSEGKAMGQQLYVFKITVQHPEKRSEGRSFGVISQNAEGALNELIGRWREYITDDLTEVVGVERVCTADMLPKIRA